MKSINERIKKYVKDNNTTREALANGIGISRSSLYDKIGEKSPWTLDEAIAMADFMGCTVQDLITEPEA
jgi:DNA-binding XRE family transcriptional regulator